MDSSTDLLKSIVDSGENYHMCNKKRLCINTLTSSGPTSHITLGDGCTRAQIMGSGTINFIILTGKTVQLHNALYVPTLNAILFSVKQQMQYIGWQKYSKKNVCLLVFPTFTIHVSNKNKLEFIVTQSLYSSTTNLDFNEETSIVYTSEPPQTLLFHHLDHTRLHKVSITPTIQTKPFKYIPLRLFLYAVRYSICDPHNMLVGSNFRKAITLGFSISIPPDLYGCISPLDNLAINHNINSVGVDTWTNRQR